MNHTVEAMESYSNDAESALSITTASFLMDYSKNEDAIFCFFEGVDDPSFYRTPIDVEFDYRHIFIYYCMGIDSLFQYHAELKDKSLNWEEKFNKHRILFFADRDFDDYIGKIRDKDENIFRTEWYSAENYVYNRYMIMRILTEVYFLEKDDEISKILGLYDSVLEEFIEYMIPITGLVIFIRKNNINSINLKKFDLSDFFTLKYDNIASNIVFQKIKVQQQLKNSKSVLKYKSRFSFFKKNSITTKGKVKSLKGEIQSLKNESKKNKFIRGHYLYILFSQFLKNINLIIKDSKTFIERKKELERIDIRKKTLERRKMKIYSLSQNKKERGSNLLMQISKELSKIKNLHKYNSDFNANLAFGINNEKILFAFLAPRARVPKELIDFLQYNRGKLDNAAIK